MSDENDLWETRHREYMYQRLYRVITSIERSKQNNKRKNVKERDMEEKYEADLFGKPGGVLIKFSDLANQTKWFI